MRIAQVAPLFERVPPTAYGGTERVVAYLADSLEALGHDVTLFASGDSETDASLVPCCQRALRLDPDCHDFLAHHIKELELVARHADRFDIIHFHTGFLHLPLARRLATPSVTTLHGRLDLPDLAPLMEEFSDMPLVSISDAQRRPLAKVNWRGTVYHGLPSGLLPFRPTPQDYVAFVGRISPEKRVDRAIEIARHAGLHLKIAAKVDVADREYFEKDIRALLDDPGVTFVGEIDEVEKAEFIGGARAVLFPIDWPEPFGLIVIEALSCGTPVIAWGHGSVPELIEPGVNGWIVDDIEDAAHRLRRIADIDRRNCRASFEDRFLDERMALDYVAIYEELVAESGRGYQEALTA